MSQKIITVLLLGMSASTAFASGDGSFMDNLLPFGKMYNDIIYQGVNLLILLVLLHLFAKKPIVNALKASASNTKNQLEASEKEVEAKKVELDEFNAKIVALEKELIAKQAKAIASIEADKIRILEDAAAGAKHLAEKAEKRIQQNLLKAKAELREFMVNEAADLAEKGLAGKIDKKTQQGLMDSYISTLSNIN